MGTDPKTGRSYPGILEDSTPLAGEISIGRQEIRWSRWAEIDLCALRENLRALKALLAPEVAILPVVKSDAYGHGLIPVARALAEEGVYGFGVSEVFEALLLRESGLEHPILLLSGFEPFWLSDLVRLRLTPVITDLGQLEALIRYLARQEARLSIHLKVNTGMNRFGLDEGDFKRALALLREAPQVVFEGLMSHFVCSECPQDPLTREQLRRFNFFREEVWKRGFRPRFLHFSNSGGVIFLPEAHFQMVRPGIALYGAYPTKEAAELLRLRPVMTFWGRILSIRAIRKGEPLGYGPTYRAPGPRKIALVPVGYEDGYFRALSNRGFAVVRGKRVSVVGAVSMKCLFLDVTALPAARPGDQVVLLGGPKREVPAEELAERAGTISYELFCALGSRAVRVYKD